MYNVWLYDIICIWVWLCKYMNTCVVLCEIVSVVIMALCDVMISQYDIYMRDMILCYECVMISGLMLMYLDVVLSVLHDWNLYVVLNTTCSYIWCYVMWFGIYKVWLLWLYNAVMCVYVDNYVDNSLIYVDNFLLQMQHFYELFWKYYIFVYFRTLSLIISCLLFLSLFFIILL